MFNLLVTVQTSYGNNINNSNLVKKINQYSEIYRTNSDYVIVEHYIKKMVDTAKKLVPVRTGNLKSAILMRKTGTGFIFYVDNSKADYAAYVEGGTRKMRAQPYFVPAVDQHRDPLRKALINFYRGRAVSGRS